MSDETRALRRRRRARAVVGCLTLACGGAAASCSATPIETPPVPTVTRTQTTSAPEVPRPAPKTSGLAVVLGLRQPTGVNGMEWTHLLPEARLVTLLPEDPEKHRGIADPTFYLGPNGALVSIDSSGVYHLTADGAKHALRKLSWAGFDAKGQSLLGWDSTMWYLFSRAGVEVRSDNLAAADAQLLPTGVLLERGTSWTRVVRPPSSVLMNEQLPCSNVYAEPGRLVCFQPRANPKPITRVFSLTDGTQLAEIAELSWSTGKSGFAVRKDGGALAIVRDEAKVVELKQGVAAPWPRVIGRNVPYSYNRPARVAFTADGAQLCIENVADLRIAKTAPPGGWVSAPKGKRLVCVFSQRSRPSVHPNGALRDADWEAWVTEAPVHDGFEPVQRSPTYNLDVVAGSADRKVAALLEQKLLPIPAGMRWTVQAVVVDATTKSERRTIPVGESDLSQGGPPSSDPISLSLSEDGSQLAVCSTLLLSGTCRTYDTKTGAFLGTSLQKPAWGPPSDIHSWSGPSPEARVADVTSALPPAAKDAPTIASWRDEGDYLSIELDSGGGVSQRLNLKDSATRTAKDVAVVGKGLLAVASAGSVAVWSLQPIELLTALVPAPPGIVALFPDGTFESIGDADKDVACQKGELIVPVAECGELRAPDGTLGRVLKSASR